MKLGPTATPDEAVALCERAQPRPGPGPAHAHHPHGRRQVADALPPLLEAVTRRRAPGGVGVRPDARQHVHVATAGRKTRHFDDVLDEIAGFFAAHRAEGTWPGGVHVELTGDDVTECLGGAEEILDADLDDRYETMCDPRLNARQSLDLAFRVAELLRDDPCSAIPSRRDASEQACSESQEC